MKNNGYKYKLIVYAGGEYVTDEYEYPVTNLKEAAKRLRNFGKNTTMEITAMFVLIVFHTMTTFIIPVEIIVYGSVILTALHTGCG